MNKPPQLTIALVAGDGSTATVAVRAVVGPFLIHRPAFAEDMQKFPRAWFVTHARTGLLLCRALTLAKAHEIAAHCTFVMSWAFSRENIPADRIAERVRPIIASYTKDLV